MYEKLLSLCGFEPNEVMEATPRIEKVIEKVGLTKKDFERAEERVNTYYDVELKGIRKILGVFVKEFIHLVLCREEREKVIYSMVPSLGGSLANVANYISKDVYAGFPDVIILFVMGALFGKTDYIYNSAENHCLPAGVAHCALDQIRLGRYLLELTPKPDLHISCGIFCDEAQKVDDLISEYFNIPTAFVNCCKDGWTVNKEGLPEVSDKTIRFVADEIKRAVGKMSKVIGVEITDEMMLASLFKNLEYLGCWAEIGSLLHNDPVPLSQLDMGLLHLLAFICVQEPEEMIDACRILLEEVKHRVARGVGPFQKGSPKIIYSGLFIGNPNIIRQIEDSGLSISVAELQCFLPNGELRFDLGDVEDLIKAGPYMSTATIFSKNSFFSDFGQRIHVMTKACEYWNVDGILLCTHANCRNGSTDALMLKDALTRRTGLPTLFMEGDYYDTRLYDALYQKVRLETFTDMVKLHKVKSEEQSFGISPVFF